MNVGEHERGGDVARPIGENALQLRDRVVLTLVGEQQPGQHEAGRDIFLVGLDRTLQLLFGLLPVTLLVVQGREDRDQLGILRIVLQRHLHDAQSLVDPLLLDERRDLRPERGHVLRIGA